MRIIQIVVGSESEPSEAVTFVCGDLDRVEDNLFVELVLDILVGRPLHDTEPKEMSLLALNVEL